MAYLWDLRGLSLSLRLRDNFAEQGNGMSRIRAGICARHPSETQWTSNGTTRTVIRLSLIPKGKVSTPYDADEVVKYLNEMLRDASNFR